MINATLKEMREARDLRRAKKLKKGIIASAFILGISIPVTMGFAESDFEEKEMKYAKTINLMQEEIEILEAENERLNELHKVKKSETIDKPKEKKPKKEQPKEQPKKIVDPIESEFAYVDMPYEHKKHVVSEASKYDNVDPHLIFALIKQESNNDPKAVSPTGARGYGQFIYTSGVMTYENLLKLGKYEKDMAFDPYINITMTCRYFNWLMDLKEDEDVALAFYNGFSDPNYVSNVRKWLPSQEVAYQNR